MLYYTADFLCLQVFILFLPVFQRTAQAAVVSYFGSVIFRSSFVVVAENFYKITARRKTTAIGDFCDLQVGALQELPCSFQPQRSQVLAETYAVFVVKYPREICRTENGRYRLGHYLWL